MATLRRTARTRRKRLVWAAGVALFGVCAFLRFEIINRQGLWADEFFTLAMATGHSMEHPADKANAAMGDFQEFDHPVAPAAYARYLKHDDPPASADRVLRAVFLSETSPPLYFLLLNHWTRLFGTSDAALRGFSTLCSLACFPLLWSLARQLGGRAAWLPACALFTFAPVSVYYATEGRMYALVWFCAAALMWLTLRLQRRGLSTGAAVLWVLAGSAGLLSHYFFAFVWLAALAWLIIYPGRLSRGAIVAGALVVGLLVLPWYRLIPASLSNWRATGYWLNLRPDDFTWPTGAWELFWSFFSISGTGGKATIYDKVIYVAYVTIALGGMYFLGRSLFLGRRLLLWLTVLAACAGVIAFDRWRGTYATAVPRYVLAALPAAFLLAAVTLARLRPLLRYALLFVIILSCLTADRQMYKNRGRSYEAAKPVGEMLARKTLPGDLVIVHSIPSGVAGIARYMEAYGLSSPEIGFASWVGQLKQRRVPQSLQSLAAGRRRIVLVRIHEVLEPAPEQTWLEQNARPALDEQHRPIGVGFEGYDGWANFYVPKQGDTFFPKSP